jgi:hypothetical protein
VAAAVALALASGVDEGRVMPPPATAAEALERAARAAETRAPELFPRPDQAFYVRSRGTNLSCVGAGGPDAYCGLVTKARESWTSERRAGRVRERFLERRWPSEKQRRRWEAAGRPRHGEGALPTMRLGRLRWHLGNERLSRRELLALDDTPAQLFRRLRDGVHPGQGPSRHGEVFAQISDALRSLPAPRRLRATLYRAMKHVPGVRLLGEVRDPVGRPALGVARTEDGVRTEVLFDPATATMLAEREVVVDASSEDARWLGAAPGTVLAGVVYEQRAVVDAVGARPARCS